MKAKLCLESSILFSKVLFWRKQSSDKDLYFSFTRKQWKIFYHILGDKDASKTINALVRPSFGDFKCIPGDINS